VTQHQENTLPAIQAALHDPNCDGVEFDVFLTQDEKVVLFHDESLKRLTGEAGNIHEITWPELQQLSILKEIEVDGGLRTYPREERISLLEDVLEELRGKDFFINIELKAYMPRWAKRHTGQTVAEVVRRLGVEEQVVGTSFDFFMLWSLEKAYRSMRSGFAYTPNMPLSQKWLNRIAESNFIGRLIHSNVICLDHRLIDADTVSKFHRRNMAVGSFTLFPLRPAGEEDPEADAFHAAEARRLTELGVDWIETDDPEKLKQAIG
jgi:glycerophosphoryl diester phosphodiesterase